MNAIKYIVLLTYIAMNLVDEPAPPIFLEQGTVVGKINGDGSIHEYLGIPYASVNQSARFQSPLPPPKWTGQYRAIQPGYQCPQKLIGTSTNLDCLNMNVYVPALRNKPLPVMVFIHGGGFTMGSGSKAIYNPEFLVKHNVIVATFNYRLGALGFLCLRTKEAPGNAGLKDQVAALRWIKRNIVNFGGDPDNITIFGESAGAVSVSYLIASNVTDGLFQRAIVQSGSSLGNWAANREPVWSASLLAKALGHETNDTNELYEIFSKEPIDTLIGAKTKKPWNVFYDTEMIHLPCVEEPIPGEEAIVLDIPYNLLKNTKKNISVIYGYNSREGIFLMKAQTSEEMFTRNDGYLFASDLEFPNDKEAKDVAKVIKEMYYGDELITLENYSAVIELYTEMYFSVPEHIESEILLENTNNITVYNYYFNYSGYRNVVKYLGGFMYEAGACHGDELFYMFNPQLWPFPIVKSDRAVIGQMTAMWTNFAKYGNPTPPSSGLSVNWTPSERENLTFLYIDSNFSMGSVPSEENYRIWRDIYSKYRRKSWD